MIAPSSKILAAGSIRLLTAGEMVIGQPTCFIISGSGFSLQAIAALGSAIITLEDPCDAAENVFVASAGIAAGRRLVAVEQTTDAVKTLFLVGNGGGDDGGIVDFLVLRV